MTFPKYPHSGKHEFVFYESLSVSAIFFLTKSLGIEKKNKNQLLVVFRLLGYYWIVLSLYFSFKLFL